MRLTIASLGSHYRVLVVGGGAGGMGASHKFARKLPQGSVAVVEGNETHYYQPGFTLVGGGLMTIEANTAKQADLIHPKSVWIKDQVAQFKPESNKVILKSGDSISYDYMIVATGLQLRFDKVKGLPEAFNTPGVCSNYHSKYVQKTYKELQNFKSGNCVFTLPNTLVKCPGAPQKVCYISEEVLTAFGTRDKAHFIFATALPRLFGIDAYRLELEKVANAKHVDVKTRTNLIEVDSSRKVAIFEHLDENSKPNGTTEEIEYSMLHVGPPCSPIEPLMNCQPLSDANGWLDVDPGTLQTKAFPNVFGVGDCMNTPNAKTAAAVSSHLKTVEKNLCALLDGKPLTAKYDLYGSCPLVVGTSKAIMAEFTPNGRLETMPFDQSKPKYLFYLMKRYLMPWLYWNGLIKGYWNGPGTMRKIFHLGQKQ